MSWNTRTFTTCAAITCVAVLVTMFTMTSSVTAESLSYGAVDFAHGHRPPHTSSISLPKEQKEYFKQMYEQIKKGHNFQLGGHHEKERKERGRVLLIVLIVLGSVLAVACLLTGVMVWCCMSSSQRVSYLKVQAQRRMYEMDPAAASGF